MRRRVSGEITNLYLCPVSTKVQVLGFGLYHLTECVGKNSVQRSPLNLLGGHAALAPVCP